MQSAVSKQKICSQHKTFLQFIAWESYSKTMAFKRINFYFRWNHSTWILIECLIFLVWESSSKLSRFWMKMESTVSFSWNTNMFVLSICCCWWSGFCRASFRFTLFDQIINQTFFLPLKERIGICQRERLTKRKKIICIMHEKALVINCACEIGNQRNVCN